MYRSLSHWCPLRELRCIATAQFQFQVCHAFFKTQQSVALRHDHGHGYRASGKRNDTYAHQVIEVHACTFGIIR